MRIREATPDDAAAIARVRIDTWRAAYAGLVPDEVLAPLDVEAETPRVRQRLETSRSAAGELVAEVDGNVVGWAAWGGSPDDPAAGELFALYVLPGHWDTGIGHALLVAAEEQLRRGEWDRAVLWHLDGNDRAARFYARHGWELDGAEKDDDRLVGGAAAPALHELRRGKDLRQSALANTTTPSRSARRSNPTRG